MDDQNKNSAEKENELESGKSKLVIVGFHSEKLYGTYAGNSGIIGKQYWGRTRLYESHFGD